MLQTSLLIVEINQLLPVLDPWDLRRLRQVCLMTKIKNPRILTIHKVERIRIHEGVEVHQAVKAMLAVIPLPFQRPRRLLKLLNKSEKPLSSNSLVHKQMQAPAMIRVILLPRQVAINLRPVIVEEDVVQYTVAARVWL